MCAEQISEDYITKDTCAVHRENTTFMFNTINDRLRRIEYGLYAGCLYIADKFIQHYIPAAWSATIGGG